MNNHWIRNIIKRSLSFLQNLNINLCLHKDQWSGLYLHTPNNCSSLLTFLINHYHLFSCFQLRKVASLSSWNSNIGMYWSLNNFNIYMVNAAAKEYKKTRPSNPEMALTTLQYSGDWNMSSLPK